MRLAWTLPNTTGGESTVQVTGLGAWVGFGLGSEVTLSPKPQILNPKP